MRVVITGGPGQAPSLAQLWAATMVRGELSVTDNAPQAAAKPTAPTVEACPPRSTPYERLMGLIATDQCVLLDGATGTELIGVSGQRPQGEGHLWGLPPRLDPPGGVLAVHRRYVEPGCDLISTNTWGLPTALRRGGVELMGTSE